MSDIKHILRFGTTADQDYFTGFDNCYDIIAINASMAAFAPKALAIFVAKKTPEKDFLIDPMTHLFQHNRGFISSEKNVDGEEKSVIKRSIANLINEYASQVEGHSERGENRDATQAAEENYKLLRNKIRNEEIDEDFYREFTQSVLAFQRNIVPEDKVKDYSTYIDYANKSVPEREKVDFQDTPIFLIAPYFYIQANDKWVDKNMELIKQSLESAEEGEEVYAQLVISKKLIDKAILHERESELDKIIARYLEQEVSGYLVWVDDYSEHEEPSESLSKYTEVLGSLRQEGVKKVHVLYGGYFSTLLGHKGITKVDGVAHGLEYGEARAVVPVGGGIPRAKFYLPKLHKRVDFPDMVEFLREKNIDTRQRYLDEVCDCEACGELIKTDNILDEFTSAFGETKSTTIKRGSSIVTLSFSTKETKDHSLRHYLAAKKKEFDELDKTPLIETAKVLRETHEEYEEYFDGSYTSHLAEWTEALVPTKEEGMEPE